MTANEVRIIGGNLKGRKLRFPAARNLRPTLGRVRETLFSWLAAYIGGSRCLDLFAGSGALGFEALSRGAAQVTLVERDRAAAQALRENAARLGLGPACCEVVSLAAARMLQRDQPPYDVIFLDPPFADASLPSIIRQIRDLHRLRPGGLVYFEMPRRDQAVFEHFAVHREGTAGDTRFGLLREQSAVDYTAPDVAGAEVD